MTRYKVLVTLVNGDVFTLKDDFESFTEANNTVIKATRANSFLAASSINGPAYINAGHIASFCYYETEAE